MDGRQALSLVGALPGRDLRALFDRAEPVDARTLREGVWLGRNGGTWHPLKWAIRRIVQRDFFAKLIFDGVGINVRVRQSSAHELRRPARDPEGLVVDMPFWLGERGLDYGFHVLGVDVPGALQVRDALRRLSLADLCAWAPPAHLGRVGARRGESGPDDEGLVLGTIAPLALDPLAGLPFGMIWHREASASEVASARRYLSRSRLFDTSAGRIGRAAPTTEEPT